VYRSKPFIVARVLCCLFVDLIWRNLLYIPVERETLFRVSLALGKILLEHGALPNVADANGESPLILSSQTCSDEDLVQLLLDAKADPNAKTTIGSTALMAAARNPIVAEKLLRGGADPAAKDQMATQRKATRVPVAQMAFIACVSLYVKRWQSPSLTSS
jgi:hypothetical protein